MPRIHPFRALRPLARHARDVASVPYDVVDTEEARALAAGNPLSFLHVVRPEIDLPPETDPHADAVYAQGRAAFDRLRRDGVLVPDDEPQLYIYRLATGGHRQTAVVGCFEVDAYDRGLIKRHELTRPEKVEDRTRHALALEAHAGPVFLAHRDDDAVRRLVGASVDAAPPLADFTAADGVRHTVFLARDAAALAAAFERIPALYVADGHHRAAAYSQVAAVLAGRAPSGRRSDEAARFLAAAFPASELRILPYNRFVHDLGGLTPAALLARLARTFAIVPDASPSPATPGRFALYLEGRWYGLAAPTALLEDSDPVARLDAAILQTHVLGPLLGIDDPRTSRRITFVGGDRGADALAARVDAQPGSCAFSLHPLRVASLLEVADLGRVLPPKSTWFDPKLRSGLLVHLF